MSRQPLVLPMSQIIATDAPLLSPVSPADPTWDQLYSPTNVDSFGFGYYPSPPNSARSSSTDSPMPTASLLKMRMSPDSVSESDHQLCLPTHQLFDFPENSMDEPSPPCPPSPPSASSSSPQPPTLPTKRSCSPAPAAPKRPRASGERVSSKDFVPPDVSGLSKREARLVKNRAAAFLSRQRKREEFESMEIRVAELEQENARLLAMTQSGKVASYPEPDQQLLNKISQLQTQLAAAEKRERDLHAEISRKSVTSAREVPVKVEAADPHYTLRNSAPLQPIKSSTSLGLMVLLCALPSLLSMPTQNALPTSFSFPSLPVSSSAFDYNSFLSPDSDWSRLMDLDLDDQTLTAPATAPPRTQHLEFADIDSAALRGMDISFDASRSEGGKIRVRIYPAGAGMQRDDIDASFPMDPFLNTASTHAHHLPAGMDFGLLPQLAADPAMMFCRQPQGFEIGGTRRRVRVALKSMPSPGREGGEWEVEVC